MIWMYDSCEIHVLRCKEGLMPRLDAHVSPQSTCIGCNTNGLRWIHEHIQTSPKCVNSPMEQKCLHFPGGGAPGTWKVRSCTYYTRKVCNLTSMLWRVVLCANIMCLWLYKLFKESKQWSTRIGVRHAAVSLFQSSDKNKSQLYYLCTVGKVRTCASMISLPS